jgi:hypothetical protein
MTSTLTIADAPQPLVRDATSLGYLVIGATAVVHVCMAPLRRLTFDEAYYACGATHGMPWPIHQHPPLLGLLLRATSHLGAIPVELRVRIVSLVLSALTSLGVAYLAAAIATPAHRARAFFLGALIASWGVLPMAGAVQAIPEMPLLASLAWLLWAAHAWVQGRGNRVLLGVALVVLSALALESKGSAVPCVFAVVAALAWRRSFGAAAAVALGALLAAPNVVAAFLAQTKHAVGHGPLVSSPHVGVFAALVLGGLAMFVVFGPAAIVYGVRSRGALASVPGGVGCVALITAACAVSAITSGRLPEVHWFAPASVPLYAAAGAVLAGRAVPARRALVSHVLPTVAAVVAWCMPIRGLEKSDFFAEAPHVAFSPTTPDLPWIAAAERVRTIPAYGVASWRCVYAGRCGDIDGIFDGRSP